MKKRRGRPRKTGQRYPSGKLRQSPVSPREVAAAMPHRRGLGDKATDQRAETALGRLVLIGLIAPELGTAGDTYCSLWRGYLYSIAGPQQLSSTDSHGFSCDGCPDPERRKYCRCDFRRRIFEEARNVLFRAGMQSAMQVYLVATQDQRCSDLTALRVGLTALARHFGLTPREKGLLPKSSIECVAPAPS
jgi:hypothetical protein